MRKEEQESLSPQMAIDLLKEGNKRFISNLKTNRNLLQQVNETADGQFPFAFILSCIDSRTSAELIFDRGLGEIFSCRIAGNILNEDILGSMEFACRVAGAKAIVVLGHTRCGAVKGACDHVEMGHITALLKKLQPAVDAETTVLKERNGDNETFVEKVSSLNVKMVANAIPERSPVLRDMLNSQQICIIGGMYDVETGKVDFYAQEEHENCC